MRAVSAASRSTRSCRATRTSAAVGRAVQLLRPGAAQPGEPHRSVHPDSRPARERAASRPGRIPSATTGRPACQLNGADFYDLFGPTKTSRKGYALGVGYTRRSSTTSRGDSTSTSTPAYYGDLERLPDYQNVPTDFDVDAGHPGPAPLQRPPPLPGQRRRGEGVPVGLRLRRRRRQGRVVPEVPFRSRPRLRPAPQALLDLAPELGRLLSGRPRRAFRQLLLRRLRQQLGGSWRGEAVPRVVQLPRLRAERDRGDELRKVHARVEPAADPVPPRGQPGVLPHLGAACALRVGPGDEHGRPERREGPWATWAPSSTSASTCSRGST